MAGQLGQAKLRIGKLEEELNKLDDVLQDRDQEIHGLKKQLKSLQNVGQFLGCDPDKVENGVLDLDHAECRQHISGLEAQLNHKDAELQHELAKVAAYTKTVKELRDTAQSLRDELKKHGIREPLDSRLRQLGFVSDPTGDDGSSANSDASNRYGSGGSDA
ncbi:hypothetical protein AAVH_17471 [Aphelenchoides avenae]|nr:hypothetical protein AAVH_17471 [Aphelenchus avenae]